jgi:uncharacterized protein (TIGR03437 family)
MIRTILRTSVSFCPSFCIFVLLTASLLRAGNAVAALQISNENAPAGGFAQIKIYAAKPTAIASGHIVVTLDQTFFGNAPQVGLFGANGDALGLASMKWPQIDIQYSSASGGIGQLASLPVIVISVPVLATATGTSVVSATSPDRSATVTSGSVTVQETLSVGKIPAGLGVAPAGTVVPITGTGFTPSTTMTIDGAVIDQANYVSPTEIDVTLGGSAELVGKRARVMDSGVEFDYFCFQPNDPLNFPENTGYGPGFANLQPLFPIVASTSSITGGAFDFGATVVQNPNPTAANVSVPSSIVESNSPMSIPPGSWAIFYATGLTYAHVTSNLPVRVVGISCVSHGYCPEAATGVQVSAPTTAGLSLAPSSLQFSWQTGTSAKPAARTVSSAPYEYGITAVTVTQGASWLSASIASQFASEFTVSVDPSNLAPGAYNGSILVTAYYGGTSTLPVTLSVTKAPVPVISASSPSLTFNAAAYNAATYSQSIAITSDSGATAFSVSVGPPGSFSWLKVSPLSGTAPATLTITWDPSAALQYCGSRSASGLILVDGPGNQLMIPVTLNVTAVQTSVTCSGPTGVGPGALIFSAQTGTAAQTQLIGVDTAEVQDMRHVTASVDQPWMTATAAVDDYIVQVTANPVGLAPGVYKGNVTVSQPGLNSIAVPVTFSVWSMPPKLTITQGSFTIVQQQGGPMPPLQPAEIDSGGISTPISIGLGANWLGLSVYRELYSGSFNNKVSALTPVPIQVGAYYTTPTSPGQYSGSFTVTSPGDSIYVPVTLLVEPGLWTPPVVSQVANAASGIAGSVSPGEILEVRGYSTGASRIGGLQLSSAGTVETSLNGLMMTFDGVPAPIIYTSANQTNLVVPYEVAGKASTSVQLTYNSMQTAAWTIPVAASAPGIFTVDSTGTGQAAAVNQDGTVNSAANPAARGSVVSIYATGEGQTSPAGVTGSVTKAPNSPVAQVSVSIGGVAATVQYAGSAPRSVAGVLQVNAVVPASVTSVPQAVMLTVGGVASQPGVTIAVK